MRLIDSHEVANASENRADGSYTLASSDEPASMVSESQGLAAQLEAVRRGAVSVLHELDTSMLARSVARQAAHLLRAEYALVELLAQERPYFRTSHRHHRVESTEDLPADQTALNSLSRWVIWHRQPYLFIAADAAPDPSKDPSRRAPCADLIEEGCRDALCVPMLDDRNDVIGLLQVRNQRGGGGFSQRDLAIAETIALQASIGLERTRLFDRMQQWTRSQERLLGFNAIANRHSDSAELICRLVEHTADFLQADGGLAGLVETGDSDGESVMSSETYWHRGEWHDWNRTWRPLEGLPGHILQNEFPHLSNEYAAERKVDPELLARFDVHRALCVPIKDVSEGVIGFLELHKGPGRTPFTWQDAAFVESLANTTAVALRNAQLMKALETKSHQIQALSAHNLLRLEEERKHIARELHDEAGQALIAIQLGLQVLSRQVRPELRPEVAELIEQVGHSTRLLGNLARRLRPPTLDRLGLDGALRQLALDYQKLLGIPVVLDWSSACARLPQTMELALYRIAQEALTNTAKYSQATRVEIALHEAEGEIFLSIHDDGRGFSVEAQHNGLGLMGMKERADMLGGQLLVHSKPGQGSEIAVRVPLA